MPGPARTTETRTRMEMILQMMRKLTSEDRLEVMLEFCVACGRDDPKCQCKCWSEE